MAFGRHAGAIRDSLAEVGRPSDTVLLVAGRGAYDHALLREQDEAIGVGQDGPPMDEDE